MRYDIALIFKLLYKPGKGKITRHLDASVPPLNLGLRSVSAASGPPGYEHDAAGALVPGATSSPQHHYNLAEMGLAWHENVEAEPGFGWFVEHIKNEIRGS